MGCLTFLIFPSGLCSGEITGVGDVRLNFSAMAARDTPPKVGTGRPPCGIGEEKSASVLTPSGQLGTTREVISTGTMVQSDASTEADTLGKSTHHLQGIVEQKVHILRGKLW